MKQKVKEQRERERDKSSRIKNLKEEKEKLIRPSIIRESGSSQKKAHTQTTQRERERDAQNKEEKRRWKRNLN